MLSLMATGIPFPCRTLPSLAFPTTDNRSVFPTTANRQQATGFNKSKNAYGVHFKKLLALLSIHYNKIF
jgi:hypothetical protein